MVASPPALSEQLKLMDYRIEVNVELGRNQKDKFLEDLYFVLDKRFEVAEWLLNNHEWDFAQIHIMETDRMNHYFWTDNMNDGSEYRDLIEFYDSVVVGTKDLERLWIEGMMESDHNVKLRKMLIKIEKETSVWGLETLKQVRDNTELLTGYSDSELYDITGGFGALYKGTLVERLMGKSPKEVRMSWIQTVYAIYNSKNNLKR